jgi:hypothetical protein
MLWFFNRHFNIEKVGKVCTNFKHINVPDEKMENKIRKNIFPNIFGGILVYIIYFGRFLLFIYKVNIKYWFRGFQFFFIDILNESGLFIGEKPLFRLSKNVVWGITFFPFNPENSFFRICNILVLRNVYCFFSTFDEFLRVAL